MVGHNKNSDQDIIDKRNSISGSVFEVILPLQPTDDNNDDNNNNNSKENKEEQNKAIDRNLDYIENDENSCVENKREDKNEISSDNKTILMIDDEEAAHMAMDIMLSGTDYKLISAYGGIEGLEMIRSYRREIDLVLLDLMMPDMDGVAVLSSVRGDEEISNIKVILQTGSSDTQMIEKAKSYNIIDIINKPYDRAKILDMLSKYFK
ncbi:MAG: response regulator [Sphingobacteriaceae bacterium]|nr:MAG: response regulator [Sphingobacteriaceae bacterium]